MALGIRADEDDAGLLQCDGKRLALGQKAVAGMDRLGARLLAGVDDLIDDEVGFGGRRWADVHGLVGHLDMEGIAVGVRIDGHRLDTHFARGLDHAAGNLAAVGNKDLLEHRPGWPRSWFF